MMNKIKKVASFTVFSNDFKNKLTTAYPFLTPDQIQLKLRKKWNDLSPHERKYYRKAVLCPMGNTTKKQVKPKKKKKVYSKVIEDKNIPLKELTLFDDELEFVSDQELEKDSFDDIFNKNEVDKLYIDVRKTPKTYKNSKNNIEHPVPTVIDETPFGQQGILKKSNSEKDRKMKVQFNFSPEHNEIKQDKKKLTPNYPNSPLYKNREIEEDDISEESEDDEDVSSKAKNKILNSEYDFDCLESNKEGIENLSSKNPILGSTEKIEELSTPEIQRNLSPKIIEKMCQAPRKKITKGNLSSIEKMDCIEKKNESLFINKLNKVVPKRKTTFPKNNQVEQKLRFDSLEFEDDEFKTISTGIKKKNKSLRNVKDIKQTNVTKSNPSHKRWDSFNRPLSPFSFEDPLCLNKSEENVNTSIGWEISDEISAPVKHSSSLENTLQLMKKSVSSSSTSIVDENPDELISDCSSLSGFSELSELDMSDVSDNDESDEKVSCESQFAVDGITAGGDSINHWDLLNKYKDKNGSKGLLCDMFEDKHTMLNRILPPPGNSGEKMTNVFENESLFD